MGWLDNSFQTLRIALGLELRPVRPTLNFEGHVTVEDDDFNKVTTVTISAGLPDPVNVGGAVIVESPAGTYTQRRLRARDIDPNFAIATFAKSAPDGSTLVYRRGDTISGLAIAATYVSGPPTSASIANTFANTATGAGAWTFNAPYSSGSKASTLTGAGTDGGADPTCQVTLTANDGNGAVTSSFTIVWTSDIYFGVSASSSIAGANVYNAGALQSGFTSSLQATRNNTHTYTLSSQYAYFLIPSTYGTPTFKDSNGFTFAMTPQSDVTITRNGVTRTYKVWRSDLLNTNFTVTTT